MCVDVHSLTHSKLCSYFQNDNAPEGTEPTITDQAAVVACEEYKVASQNDKDKVSNVHGLKTRRSIVVQKWP